MNFKDKSERNSLLQKQTVWFLLSATAFILLLGGASCTSSVPQDLTASEKLWREVGPVNYDFTLVRQCFCPEDWRGPVEIQVRNKTAVSVKYVSNGQTVTEGKFDNSDTIDKLFTILKNAYAGKGGFEQKAATINVTYDGQMGYPADFYIDISLTIADEEQGYAVTNIVAR